MADQLWFPSVEDVLAIHDDVLSEYSDTHSGIQNRGDIEFVLQYIKGARFETIHERAFHLLRLLVVNHPFVDANKRTALNTTVVFYVLNGYRFEYDDESGRSSSDSEPINRPSMKRKPSPTFVLGRTKSISWASSISGARSSFSTALGN